MRVVEEIEKFIKEKSQSDEDSKKNKGVRYTKISVVGYSLGGLWNRYAIGLLLQKGLLKTPDNPGGQLEPVLFTTFASPHAGTLFYQNTLRSNVFNSLGKAVLGQSGMDLFLEPVVIDEHNKDSRPVLEQLADPKVVFYKALAAFSHRMIFSNALNDRTVPFYTSYISVRDPFQKLDSLHLVHKPHPDLNSSSLPEGNSVNNEEAKTLLKQSYTDVYAELDLYKTTYKSPEDELKSSSLSWREIQFRATMMVIGPLFFPIVIAISSISTFFSYYRIRDYENNSKDHKLTTTSTTTPARRRNSITEDVAGITGHAIEDFLDTRESEQEFEVDVEDSQSTANARISNEDQNCNFIDTPDFSELELSPLVVKIIENLNKLTWEKHVVLFKRIHTHAEIVNRRNRPGQGEEVIRSWVNMIEDKITAL